MPDHISVIGYDDIAFAALINPPLTTIAQDKYTLGRQAMRLTLDLLGREGRPEEAGDIVLTPVLVERASCGPVP